MAWWLNWLILLALTGAVFICWNRVPTERLDRYWRWNNPAGRPFLNTVVITGIPALFAKLTLTPIPWLLIPMTFLLTQYAVLSGRFLQRELFLAGWVMVFTFAFIWVGFWLA